MERQNNHPFLIPGQAAAHAGLCTRTHAKFIKANPGQPVIFARIGRQYQICTPDLERMCEVAA